MFFVFVINSFLVTLQNLGDFPLQNLVTLAVSVENFYGNSGLIGGTISSTKPKTENSPTLR